MYVRFFSESQVLNGMDITFITASGRRNIAHACWHMLQTTWEFLCWKKRQCQSPNETWETKVRMLRTRIHEFQTTENHMKHRVDCCHQERHSKHNASIASPRVTSTTAIHSHTWVQKQCFSTMRLYLSCTGGLVWISHCMRSKYTVVLKQQKCALLAKTRIQLFTLNAKGTKAEPRIASLKSPHAFPKHFGIHVWRHTRVTMDVRTCICDDAI